ncbi:Fungal Zn(2)-Cys(6) binuclear cluster domain [Rhizoctonia solani]|uniref:Fungal Zn(2)-Cys(6) binuclear cluster domain n=1 Tax=Rhizoctonia solani TaxID=456999 RepID=A0A8H8T108_9AGAM|nr:Fungal Zn(2)-Cys(6) binuclear cluster domain [Rhizoctonia solani]QRW24267.1 Fungal Zn(2)-Cys(6) binuclear cluster domain [Rhizoctonia solani]
MALGSGNRSSNTSIYEPKRIPINPQLDPFDLDSMKSLILVQYTRLAHRIAFRPFPYPVELGLTNYLVRGSHLICKTLYLGARISQALLDDTNWQGYRLDRYLPQSNPGTQSALWRAMCHLADRLAANCNYMLHDSEQLNWIYDLPKGAPMFLQLAVKYPDLWTGDSAFTFPALHGPRHELGKFTLMDTVSALPRKDLFLEPAFACPIVVLIALARVNAHRASRLMNQDATSAHGLEECEAAVRKWKAPVDYNDQPSKIVTRLAVQEAWRQAALIYLYMGMCEARSCDGRVEPLVQQVAQLASAVEAGSPLETHLFIPCLIIAVLHATGWGSWRKERHRAILRKKIQASQKTDACLLRGADFSFVLDHLWHGAGSGGSPVTWGDYVNSRCLVLPIPAEV